jgi:hypothetical protein
VTRFPYAEFIWLLLVATLIYYRVHYIVVVVAVVVLFIQGWLWCCRRWPRTMIFVAAFLRGLLGGGRRRW